MPSSRLLQRHQPPLAALPIPFLYLLIVPGLLAVGTIVLLFFNSDVNVALLWSQCHARARLPLLSRVPLVGTALCYLPSFFQEALDSARSASVMAAVLAFVGGLLTVCLVEAARRCNAESNVIARPMGPWLVFNLFGGAGVWQLSIVPAFLYRAQKLYGSAGKTDHVDAEHLDAHDESTFRHIPREEVLAIPISVALGFYLPSILMITLNSPVVICIWILFPLLVSLVRFVTRLAVRRTLGSSSTVRLESSHRSLLFVYALPVALSVLAHMAFIGNLTLKNDDRKEMTRATMAFIEFDIQAIGCTVLYWLFVEVGWEAALALVAASFAVGPGGATCLTWAFVRERLFQDALAFVKSDDGSNDEHAPLLR